MADGARRLLPLRLIPHQDDLLGDTTSDTILSVAGLGCIAAGTRIFDPVAGTWSTVEALYAADRPITVLALHDDGVSRPAAACVPFIKGVADLYRFTTEDGDSITVTGRHRFLTPQGWQHAEHVRAGHLLGCAPSPRPSTEATTSRDCCWTRVCSITPIGRGVFYDLTVDGPPNYLAEGLWNHNSGKTTGIVIKALDLAARNWPVTGMVTEPTFPMVRKILIPAFSQFLNRHKIPWRYNKNEHVLTVRLAGRWCSIQLDSVHDPERLKGPNIAYAIVDEAGICDPGVWEHLPARVRHEDARCAQFIAVGTPEGFGAFYEWAEGPWNEADRGTRRVLRAETYDNIFLKDGPEAYIRKRLSHLDEADLQQYVRGLFVARGSRVYKAFTRADAFARHPIGNARIEVGADFNVSKSCWVTSTCSQEHCHIFGEVIGYDLTTEQMGQKLTAYVQDIIKKESGRIPGVEDVRRRIVIHCDPSAKNRSTRAAKSDVVQLREMGFQVECNRTVIPIKDRVMSVNWRFRQRALTIDVAEAPHLVRSLEQQGRDLNGDPEKKTDPDDPDRDLSGSVDAAGYLIWAHPAWRASTPQGNLIVPVSNYVGA